MGPHVLQQYLHDHIPISAAMGVEVLRVDAEGVTLKAPLGPNINHRDTVFGGSASALAILAGWSLVHSRLRALGVQSRIVIMRNTMHHDLPVPGDFSARSFIDGVDRWERFVRALERKRKARIVVSAVLEHRGATVGRFSGQFVALDGAGKSLEGREEE